MSNLKLVPDLFLEVAELERFKDFLDKDGFRKNLIENSEKFGLIRSRRGLSLSNARVEEDNTQGIKTVKINEIKAIDSEGMFLFSKALRNIPIPSNGSWYWLKISHRYSSIEEGTVSLSINGDLVGVNTKFTEILRGMPNFPSRIKFTNSSLNTLEYDILEVIDDTHAIIAHPANSGTGIATFGIEESLQYSVVGTFTSGVAIPNDNKYPFQYDSVSYELVAESINNTRPTFVKNREFYIARIKTNGTELIIQDKRTEFWATKGVSQTFEIDQLTNPLIGVEAIKYQNTLTPLNKNIVEVAWGMRSENWTVDTSRNMLTLFGSSIGGRFKTIDDFSDGDFNGWRVYTTNGQYSYVVSSIKQGQAINLTLDILDVDNYSENGGNTFYSNVFVVVVPDCEEVELLFRSHAPDLQENVNRTFTFPVNTAIAKCNIEVYKDPSCLYSVQYRYKSNESYTEFNSIPSDPIGYYTEDSFDEKGGLKVAEDRVRRPYSEGIDQGTILFQLSPNSISRFKSKVYLGDALGFKTVEGLSGSSIYNLRVSVDEQYQHFIGGVGLVNNLYINLDSTNIVKGNTFKLQFTGNWNLDVYKIFITTDYETSSPVTLKTLEPRDAVEIANRPDGIVLDFTVNDSGEWEVFYQNYDPSTVKTTGAQTIEGIKSFSSSPIVPIPTQPSQAVSKAYVDNFISGMVLMACVYLDPTNPSNSVLIKGSSLVKAITATYDGTNDIFAVKFYQDVAKTQILPLSKQLDFAIVSLNDTNRTVTPPYIDEENDWIRFDIGGGDSFSYLKFIRVVL